MSGCCFFIGHRETPETVIPKLLEEVERHISDYHVTEFVVGDYGNFDRMAAKAVIRAKKMHPDVRLTLLLPYHPADRPHRTPQGFDGTFYPPMERTPKRFAIVKANQYMVRSADYLIAYVHHPGSNARNLLEYAEKSKHAIIITRL